VVIVLGELYRLTDILSGLTEGVLRDKDTNKKTVYSLEIQKYDGYERFFDRLVPPGNYEINLFRAYQTNICGEEKHA